MAKKKKQLSTEFEGVRHKPKRKLPHVAEEYLEKGDRETAQSLCALLTIDARARVIG
jgi:hypothetical protein